MMWGKVFEIIKRFFTISDKLNRLQQTSELHAKQIQELYENQTRFHYELQLQKERDAHEREQERLRLENRQLRERVERSERLGLPPPAPKPPDEQSED